jgi:hypothetical protein
MIQTCYESRGLYDGLSANGEAPLRFLQHCSKWDWKQELNSSSRADMVLDIEVLMRAKIDSAHGKRVGAALALSWTCFVRAHDETMAKHSMFCGSAEICYAAKP